MTILRSGTTKKYSDGWEKAFGKKSSKTGSAAKASETAAKKKAAKRKPAKKKAKKK